jgi:hypothetical protein
MYFTNSKRVERSYTVMEKERTPSGTRLGLLILSIGLPGTGITTTTLSKISANIWRYISPSIYPRIDRRFQSDRGNNIAALVTLIKYDSSKAVELMILKGNSNITEHMKDLEKWFGVITSGTGRF